jgi:hypothetical protein
MINLIKQGDGNVLDLDIIEDPTWGKLVSDAVRLGLTVLVID